MDNKYYDRDIILQNSIKANEEKHICKNLDNIDEVSYNNINTLAARLRYSHNYLKSVYYSNNHMTIYMSDYYEYFWRNIDKLVDNTHMIDRIRFDLKTNEEKDLLCVLYSDPELNYLKRYLNVKDKLHAEELRNDLIKTYGFYSLTLVRLEYHVYNLYIRLLDMDILNNERGSNGR